MIRSIGIRILKGLLLLVILLCFAFTILPSFLDRIYYRGGQSGHFDTQRFFNPDGDDDTLTTSSGSGGRTGFFWRYLTHSDSRPPWPKAVVLPTGTPPARVDGRAMKVTWIGHATLLVQTEGLNILTDPVWSQTSGPFGFGPQRVAQPGVRFEDLPKIDVVLVSHDHYDHLDLPTLKRLWDRDRPQIITSLGNDAVIGNVGVPSKALDWGGRTTLRPGIDVIVSRNHHWGSRWFADRNRALWSSFIVTLPGGNFFFAGDTGFGDGQWANAAANYGPIRFAGIPIGAFRFVPGQMGIGSHIGPVDAVDVYRRLGASRAIGIHWGTFRLSYEAYDTPPKLLTAAMACTKQTGFTTARIGRTLDVPPYETHNAAPTARNDLLRCLDTPEVKALR